MSKIEILEKWLNLIAEDYKRNLDAKGHTASGNSKNKTTVLIRETGGAIEVPAYNKALVLGRKPNIKKDPVSLRKWAVYFGKTVFEKWCENKGIDKKWAVAIAYKIAEKGWTVPNAHNDGKLISDTITEEKKKALLTELGGFHMAEIKLTINDIWQ